MGMKVDNGFNIKLNAIKAILERVFENKPEFPINNQDMLTEALGGKEQTFYLNDELGELSASALAERSFKNRDNIEEPNQIIDAIVGDSYINIIAKSKCIEKLHNLKFPIDTKEKFTKIAKELLIYGIPIETIAEKLDYPIDKPEQIINRLKILDQKLIEANIDLISGITIADYAKKKEREAEKPVKAEAQAEAETVPLKQKIKKIIELGKNAYREQEYQRAIDIYDEGLELDPDNTELRFLKKSVQAKVVKMAIVKDDEGGAGEIKAEAESELMPETEAEPEPTVEADQALRSPFDADLSDKKDGPGKTFTAELEGSESKIEQLEKKLQEKVQALRDLAKPTKELAPDACKSCEGLGNCYWCKGSGTCKTCKGLGKNQEGEECADCKGAGKCHSCKGSGKCHWCEGTGKKND
ncbi:hypothetical protein [[Eubacterium] cellulosolvens]